MFKPDQRGRSSSYEEFAYVCVHGCGYTGTYEAVEQHEYMCPYAESKRMEGENEPFGRPRTQADAARLAKEIMSMQGAEGFNFADVAGFWNMAGQDWRSGANMFNMMQMAGGLEDNGFGGK